MISDLILHAKILIVDDELTNVRLLQKILAREGYHHVLMTTDPQHVITMFADDQPDLVLLDLHMPHLSGFEVMEQLRKVIPPEAFVPIIVLTADATPEAKRRALAAGATDFVCKPFDNVEVALRITNVLRTRFLHLELENQNRILDERVNERTEQLQASVAELRNAQQQIVQQERLHALGMMSTGVAHDFNNLLSLILGYSELLLTEIDSCEDSAKVTKYLQTIINAAQDGAQMVNRLAEFRRPRSESDLRQAIPLRHLIEQAIELTRPRWKEQSMANGIDIQVTTELDPIPDIAGDPAEIRELLTNLIFNAVDAMPEGGIITLRARPESDSVLLEVEDNGVGMSDEVRQRCLEPFFTTKGTDGSGLGLAMIYGIVQRHEGTLDIQTQPGVGTRFQIHLRSHPTPAAHEIAETTEACEPLSILVVDDQPVLCEVLAEYLESDWHRVTTANDGEEAIRKFESDDFHLVITDRAMPGMTGEQLAQSLRKIRKNTPIILLTGFAESGVSESLSPAIDAVIGKPVNRTTLRKAIANAVAKQGALETTPTKSVRSAGLLPTRQSSSFDGEFSPKPA